MKKVIEIYCCDVCQKEVVIKDALNNVKLPCINSLSVPDYATFELCDDCEAKVRQVIYGNFAKITAYSGEVHNVELPKNETVAAEPVKIAPKATVAIEKKPKVVEKNRTTTPPQIKTETNEEWAEEVREMLKDGKTVADIAAHYNLTKTTAYKRMNNLGISPKQFRPR